MPFDALTQADNFRVQGSMTVINDPAGNAGNVNIVGTLTASGSASFGGITGSFPSGASITGGLQYDIVSGTLNAPLTSTTQGLASGGTITMTSGLQGGSTILASCSDTSETTIKLLPISSTSTSGQFQNGVEITVVNISASGTNIVIPSGSAGVSSTNAPISISAGHAVRFRYIAALQQWVPLS